MWDDQLLSNDKRGITRQLETLRWLEGLISQSPKAGDSVAARLNPTLAKHLERANIFTLAYEGKESNGHTMYIHGFTNHVARPRMYMYISAGL